MADQGEIVRQIDEKSARAAERAGRPSRAALVLGLVFPSGFALARGLFLRGGLFRGAEGLKEAVNEAALSFVTGAKRYEKLHGRSEALEEKMGKP